MNSLKKALLFSVACLSLSAPALAQDVAPPDFGVNLWAKPLGPHFPPPSGPGPVQNPPDNPYEFVANVGNYRGDITNPILQPWAAERIAAQSAKEAAGEEAGTAQQTCRPSGVPGILQLNDLVQIVQTPDIVMFLYARAHQSRVIHMNAEHPENLTPSWYGHSIGHYEGDTLVIDTIGLNDKPWVDRYGTPQTEQMHVVERYRIIPDPENGGDRIEVHFFVEDPGAFTMPWSALTYFEARPGEPLDEQICQENNRALGEETNQMIPRAEYTYPF
ncbi:MAG: hypothetical protein RJB62_2030 [Pseudomonadota bacterium]|jgi:hypothetical protein